MKRARVVAVCSSNYWSGTEKWVLNACEELAGRGREVTLVVRNEGLFSFRRTQNLPIVRLPLKNDADMASVIRLAGVLRRRADIVILTRVRDYWLGGLAARIAGVPVLLRLGVVRRPRQRYIMDQLKYGTLSTAVLVNAEAIRNILLETSWMKNKDIHVIYNGVDALGRLVETKVALAREQIGVPSDNLLIVGAGRLAAEKRWDWLVDAVGILVDKGFPVTARLLGRGNEHGRIIQHIKDKGLNTRFILPGERRDSHLWMAAADIVALPSSNEGISNAMLEAMGREVPVVVTQSGGVDEVFTDGINALVAGTDDFDGFASRLEKIVTDSRLRLEIGRNGYATVKKRFTWQAMTDQLENVLDSLVRSGE